MGQADKQPVAPDDFNLKVIEELESLESKYQNTEEDLRC
jgi:hypothetical protein